MVATSSKVTKNSGDHFTGLQVSQLGDLFRSAQSSQAIQRGLDKIVRVIGTKAFGQYVLNTGRFENRTHGTTGDDACTIRRRPQHNAARFELADDVMGNGYIGQRDLLHIFFRLLDSFSDGLRHLVGLAKAITNLAMTITNHDDRAETEATAAFDYLGNAVDEHNFFNELFLIAIT